MIQDAKEIKKNVDQKKAKKSGLLTSSFGKSEWPKNAIKLDLIIDMQIDTVYATSSG